MTFHSILFESPENGNATEPFDEPDFFRDLNLDQIVDAVTKGREEYNLKPFFYVRLFDSVAVDYRRQIMRDLGENESLLGSVTLFATQMRAVRAQLATAEKLYYKYQQEAWLLDAVEMYCEAVEKLLEDMRRGNPGSRGLAAFRDYLARYTESELFKALLKEAKSLKSAMASIKYCLLIRGSSITVRHYNSEIDYSAVVEEAFAKFQQGAVKDYRVRFDKSKEMNHVEAQILDLVAKLNPEVFHSLDDYCSKNRSFADQKILDFDRQIQFYIAYLEFTQIFKRAGLKFCYPEILGKSKEVLSREGFDLALANRLIRENSSVVCNDFYLEGKERIFIITGPNQGGKTTFARTFGQLHYLACLGCPVPGAEARLFLFDRLFTHFEKEEDITTLRGKLQDDLVRIHAILEKATPGSVIVMNESFSSTTVQDAAYLSREVLKRISRLDVICACVTFLDELASLNEKTVSLVAAMVPDNPTLRTHRIERRPADGLSYALAIARKYGLTYEQLRRRINR